MNDRRIRLIEKLCRIDDVHLPDIELFVDSRASQSTSAAECSRDVQAQPNPWPHAPIHRLAKSGTYFVTGATHDSAHIFRSPERLSLLEDRLLTLAKRFGIDIEAWAVFSNHYHFVGHVSAGAESIRAMVSQLHSETATEINRVDETPGRQVWFNFWETHLTFENSYLCRLNYVHQNAVKHGLVKVAHDYKWCSAAWFERVAAAAQIKTIYSFKIDRVKVEDDYVPT